jgi:hypothetical protein
MSKITSIRSTASNRDDISALTSRRDFVLPTTRNPQSDAPDAVLLEPPALTGGSPGVGLGDVFPCRPPRLDGATERDKCSGVQRLLLIVMITGRTLSFPQVWATSTVTSKGASATLTRGTEKTIPHTRVVPTFRSSASLVRSNASWREDAHVPGPHCNNQPSSVPPAAVLAFF